MTADTLRYTGYPPTIEFLTDSSQYARFEAASSCFPPFQNGNNQRDIGKGCTKLKNSRLSMFKLVGEKLLGWAYLAPPRKEDVCRAVLMFMLDRLCFMCDLTRWPAARADSRDSSPARTVPQTI